MPWLARIGIGYVVLMIAAIALCQQLAHVARTLEFEWPSGDGRYRLVGYRDFPLPSILAPGREPGEVEVIDRRGNVLDGEHFENVGGISNIEWSPYKVDLFYRQDGRTFHTSLDLAQ